MNYKSVISSYLGLSGMYAAFWYWEEKYLIYTEKKEDLLGAIVGTHGGYGHYMNIAVIYMAVFLMFVFKEIEPFSIKAVSRAGRTISFRKCFLQMLELSAGYSFIYVGVQVVGVSIFVDKDILIKNNFWGIMMFYYIAVFIIFSFGGVCYLLLYVITKLKIVSLLLTIAVNIFVVFFLKADNCYFGLTIIDNMSFGGYMQIAIWLLKRVKDFAITTGIYIVAGIIYEKKDSV